MFVLLDRQVTEPLSKFKSAMYQFQGHNWTNHRSLVSFSFSDSHSLMCNNPSAGTFRELKALHHRRKAVTIPCILHLITSVPDNVEHKQINLFQ